MEKMVADRTKDYERTNLKQSGNCSCGWFKIFKHI